MVTAGPSRASSYGVLALALLLVVVGTRSDTAGLLLTLPAAVVTAAWGVRDLVLRPVLTADAAGLRVVSGVRIHTLAWSQVERLRVVTDRRTPLLELDLGTHVVVLSRGRLGRPPSAVLEDLLAQRRRSFND